MPDEDVHAYDIIFQRRLHHDNLVWQVPVLSMTAQSFLFTIALGAGTTPVARTIACVLALTISVMSVNLMIRHRAHELGAALRIESYEQARGLPAEGGFRPHYDGPRALRFLNRSAYRMWLYGLVLFGIAALVTVVITWLPLGWLK